MTVLVGLAWLSAPSCSDNSPTDTDDEPSGALSAQIDGQSWSATTRNVTYVSGTVTVTGTDGSQRTVLVAAANVTAPGSFQLTQGNPNGAIASVIEGAAIWSSSVAGGTGTLTISVLTATRVKGSFTFTGLPATASATGTRAVTSGQFDLAY